VGLTTTGQGNPDIPPISFSILSEHRAAAIRLKFSDQLGICPRQAENVFGRISQALTAAVVLVMVCPHERAALRILIGGGVPALNAT
jgi:hypothetical protein